MIKNNFKSLLLMTFIAIYFSSNLFAMQSVVEKQAVESSPLLNESEDAFIREFVKAVDDSNVEYDGKSLKLYLDTNSSMKRPLIFMAVFMLLGFGCLLESGSGNGRINDALPEFGLLFASLGMMSELYIIINLIFKSPTLFLVIDSKQIETFNNIKMKWADASIMKFLSDNSIMFCNKEGIPLFVINNNNLPIKLSELIVILGSYLKEYGAKE